MDPPFFSFLTERQQKMAREMIQDGNITLLRNIVQDENYQKQITLWIESTSNQSLEGENQVENEYEIIDGPESLPPDGSNIYLEPNRRPEGVVNHRPPADATLSLEQITLIDNSQTMNESIYASIDHPESVQPEETLNQFKTCASGPVRFNNISPELLARLGPETTILLLSESGTGKSTHVNGQLNYLRYGSIEEAMKHGVELVIKSNFSHVDEDKNATQVISLPTIEPENCPEGWLENENTSTGASSTQLPKPYVINVGPPGQEKIIRLIDTPGIGDTRGMEQEEINVKNILDLLSYYPKIHAICILLKSNDSRLSMNFRYCLSELLTHLHTSAANNILFAFTQVRGTQYKPGESLNTLRKFLNDLDKKDISVTLNNSNRYFCFDNDCIRFLCAHKEGIKFDEKEINSFKESWDFSSKETAKLLSRVAEMSPHNTADTLSINNTRLLILALSRPLAELDRIKITNKKLIDEKIIEIEKLMTEEKNLRGRLYVKQAKLVPKNLEYPITVCVSKSCVDHRRMSNDPNSPMEIIYKTVCHEKCYLNGVETSIVPNPALQNCYAFQANMNKCRTCSCPWSSHMHIRYRLEMVLEKTKDVTVEDNLHNYKEQALQGKAFVEDLRAKKAALELEFQFTSACCVKFATFLNSNSILPYNDAYSEYLDHLINEEKNKIYFGESNRDTLEFLEKRKREYDQKISVLKRSSRHLPPSPEDEPPLTPAEIHNLVEQLKTQPLTGNLLKEIQEMELLCVKKEKTNFGPLIKCRK